MATSLRKAELRVRDVEQMASRAIDADTPALLQYLRDPSPYVANIAADALCERSDHALALTLLTEYAHFEADGPGRDPGCYIRTALAHLFARIEYHPACDIFRSGIRTVQIESLGGVPSDMAAQLRGACASGLAEIRDAHALIDITPLLFDRGANVPINPELRSVAAKAIGRLGNPDGLAVLSILLRFPNLEDDLEVLSSCMAAAMELNPEEALPLVSGYIETEYRGLVAPAAIAIINSGVAGGEVHIGRALSVSRGDKLMAICLTLAAKRSVQGVEILYGLGSSERDDHRGAFADAVGETLDRNAAPILKVLAVSDRSLTVRAAAAKALKAIGKARDHI